MKTLLFLCSLITSGAIFAQTDLSQFKGLTIKTTGHPEYPPIIWQNKKKQMVGVGPELLDMALKEIGMKATHIFTGPWGRAQEEVKSGRIDMLIPPYINDERVKYMSYYKEPWRMDDTVVFVPKGKKFKFSEWNDLLNLKGTTIIDDSYGSEFDKFMNSKLDITKLASTEQCFNFLLKGRAAYMIAGQNAGYSLAAKMGILDKVDILDKRIVSTGMYLAISKKSSFDKKALHNYINEKIAEYNKNGTTEKLFKKYLEIYKQDK